MTENKNLGEPTGEAYDMLTCPWFQNVGSCTSGCYEEPVCQTNMPSSGWRARDERGRFLSVFDERLKTVAIEREKNRERKY